jgi:hypothetical protein
MILTFLITVDWATGGVYEMGQPILCSEPFGERKRSPPSETKSSVPLRDADAYRAASVPIGFASDFMPV